MAVEIRLRDNGSLDEIVASGESVHLERMDSDKWFLSVGDVQIWLNSDKKITTYYEDNRKDA